MPYSKILKRAWQITWHNGALWFFGVALSILSLNATRIRSLGGWRIDLNWFQLPDWFLPRRLSPPASSTFFPASWSSSAGQVATSLAVRPVVWMFLSLVLVLLVGWVLRLLSQGALVGMVDDIEQRDRTALKVGFKTGWHYLPHLMALDGLFLLLIVGLALLLGLLLTPLVLTGILPFRALLQPGLLLQGLHLTSIWHAILTIVIVLLVLLLVGVAQAGIIILREVAQREVVLAGRRPGQALRTAWRLLWSKLGQLGLMWLLVFIIELVLSLIMLPLTLLGRFVLTVPFGLVLRNVPSARPGLLLVLGLVLLVSLLGALVNGVYRAFRSSVWTLTYREAVEPLVEVS